MEKDQRLASFPRKTRQSHTKNNNEEYDDVAINR